MSSFVTKEVPFQLFGNKVGLTDEQLAEDPCLRDFVIQFRQCFEYDPFTSVWYYNPPDQI